MSKKNCKGFTDAKNECIAQLNGLDKNCLYYLSTDYCFACLGMDKNILRWVQSDSNSRIDTRYADCREYENDPSYVFDQNLFKDMFMKEYYCKTKVC